MYVRHVRTYLIQNIVFGGINLDPSLRAHIWSQTRPFRLTHDFLRRALIFKAISDHHNAQNTPTRRIDVNMELTWPNITVLVLT
jgi:hypothetical protein